MFCWLPKKVAGKNRALPEAVEKSKKTIPLWGIISPATITSELFAVTPLGENLGRGSRAIHIPPRRIVGFKTTIKIISYSGPLATSL